MKSVINLLRGVVRVRVQGMFPERLLNLCAQRGISFWGVEWEDEHTLCLSLLRRERRRLAELGERAGCSVEVDSRHGLPFFLGRFRKRYAFLAGFTLSLAAVLVLSNVVFTVQVSGNETVPTAQILGELRRLGLRPGAYGPNLELKHMAQDALLTLEDLSWMTINLHGTRAEVVVREVVQPPELVDEGGYYDIVSQADGLVTHVEALEGEALVKEGDTVLKGDVLITGNVSMKPPPYSDQPVRYYQTHARGRVWARTWRTLTAKIPLSADVKEYTGEEKRSFSLRIFDNCLDFYRNSSISAPFYDKITNVYPLVLPGGISVPAALVVECRRDYDVRQQSVDREAAQAMLEQQLEKRLTQLVGEDGNVGSLDFSAVVRDGWLSVTLQAECMEEIGHEVPAHYPLENQ